MNSAITERKNDRISLSALLNELQNKRPDGRGTLHAAVRLVSEISDAHSIIDLLLEKGADPNEVYLKKTPIHVAIECFNSKALDSIVRAGGNVNIAGPLGQTPKMLAIKRCLMELPEDHQEEMGNILAILAEKGAKI